jgi:hypothetical protein
MVVGERHIAVIFWFLYWGEGRLGGMVERCGKERFDEGSSHCDSHASSFAHVQ